MTVKELRELLNNIDKEYDDCSLIIFEGESRKNIEGIRRVCSPMGKPCCVQVKIEK